MKTFAKYRLVNQKSKGYKGLYKKLFTILNKDSIFGECFEESISYDGEDVIIETTWGDELETLPKGIIRINN
tara:strand:- start:137 stop:352 length:216 start_codon:yes stop_codon:yes gene_type:complete